MEQESIFKKAWQGKLLNRCSPGHFKNSFQVHFY